MAEIYLATILGGVGFTVITNCLGALTTSANGIYTLIGNISTSSVPDISDFLSESDIQNSIKTLEMLVREIDLKNNPTRTLTASLASLVECMTEIEKNFGEVKKRMEYNKSLWVFVSLRSYGFTDIVKKLKSLKITLDNRRNSLFDILKVNQYLTPLSESKYFDMMNTQESVIATKDSNKK
jgi:hypothetical protein